MVWNKLLALADSGRGHTKQIRHIVLFNATHESILFKHLFSGETPPSSFESNLENFSTQYYGSFVKVLERLEFENYWGFPKLKNIKNLGDKIY